MKPVAEATTMQCAAQKRFGFGVSASYPGHHAGSCFFVDDIDHRSPGVFDHR